MSNTSSLTELAEFAASTETKSKQRQEFWRAYSTGSEHRRLTKGRPVSDLLGVVIALSARTRRVLAPRTSVELDVFAPGGKRAVRLNVGALDQD